MADLNQISPEIVEGLTQAIRNQDFYLMYQVSVQTEFGSSMVSQLYGPINVDVSNMQNAQEFFTWATTDGPGICEQQARQIFGESFIAFNPKIFLATVNDAFRDPRSV